MLRYNEVRRGVFIELDGEPYEVISADLLRKQQRKPVNQTKLKNLISERLLERSFHQSETVQEAELEKKTFKYLYQKNTEVWLSALDNPKDRFNIPISLIENELQYIKENDPIETVLFKDEIIGFKLPTKISLTVKDAPPNIRGNTSAGGNKVVTLETGVKITTPLFIESGDIIEVNTQTGEYSGRKN